MTCISKILAVELLGQRFVYFILVDVYYSHGGCICVWEFLSLHSLNNTAFRRIINIPIYRWGKLKQRSCYLPILLHQRRNIRGQLVYEIKFKQLNGGGGEGCHRSPMNVSKMKGMIARRWLSCCSLNWYSYSGEQLGNIY